MTRRELCKAVRRSDGTICQLEVHTEKVHAAYVNGWLDEWMSVTEDWRNVDLSQGDPLRDAPAAFKKEGLDQ